MTVRYALLLVFACSRASYDEADRRELRVKDARFGRELEALHVNELAKRATECRLYIETIAADRAARLACTEPDMLRAYGAQQITLKHVRELSAITDPQQLAAACAEAGQDLARDEKCTGQR